MLIYTSKKIVSLFLIGCLALLSLPITMHSAAKQTQQKPKASPTKKQAPSDIKLSQSLKNDPEFLKAYEGMSPAEQEDMKKIIEEMDKITPEQWEKMAQEVEKGIEKMGGAEAVSKMSEDDMMKFIEDIAEEWETEIAKDKQVKKPAPKQKPASKKTPSTVALSAKEALLENIKSIIDSINSFSSKASAMPELPGKVESWTQKGEITEWGSITTWNAIKKHLDILLYKLNIIIKPDIKTKKMRYFDYVYENEALRNHIQLLKTKLSESEPFIDVTTFGLTKLGKKSKEATQKTLNCLGEAIQKLKLNDAFNKAIEKYEPLALEIRTMEEKLLKEAELESKKKSTPKQFAQTASSHEPYGGGGYPASSNNSSSYNAPASRVSSSNRMSARTPEKQEKFDKNRLNAMRKERAAKQVDASKQKQPSTSAPRSNIMEATHPHKENNKKINELINTFEEEIDTAVEATDNGGLLKRIQDTKSSTLDGKTKKNVDEMRTALSNATDAAKTLYHTASEPKKYHQAFANTAKSLTPFFGELQKIYPDDQIEKAYRKVEQAKKEADQTNNALEQAKQGGDSNAIQAAEAAAKTAHQALKKVMDESVPAEVVLLLDEYKNLRKAIGRFAKEKPVRLPDTEKVKKPGLNLAQ